MKNSNIALKMVIISFILYITIRVAVENVPRLLNSDLQPQETIETVVQQ